MMLMNFFLCEELCYCINFINYSAVVFMSENSHRLFVSKYIGSFAVAEHVVCKCSTIMCGLSSSVIDPCFIMDCPPGGILE